MLNRFVLIFLCFSVGQSDVPASTEGENVDADNPYTLSPELNYGLCTGDGDMQQLTDARQVSGSVSQIWLSPECVGWKATGSVEVVIDLQTVRAIDVVEVSTGSAPSADVY